MFYAGTTVQPHEALPDGYILPEGVEAWQWLLERHPSFKEIHWVAQRLGIASGAAKTVALGTDLLRKFCYRCR